MSDIEYNKPLTVGALKEAIKDIPDNVVINVLNQEGDSTANIHVLFEDLQSRQFVELVGFKPFYKMSEEEKRKCV